MPGLKTSPRTPERVLSVNLLTRDPLLAEQLAFFGRRTSRLRLTTDGDHHLAYLHARAHVQCQLVGLGLCRAGFQLPAFLHRVQVDGHPVATNHVPMEQGTLSSLQAGAVSSESDGCRRLGCRR